ncbi:MAG: hypothetical protein LBP83_02750, partial [Dysgonamonadaceae bacterium]|nr:hypothetical protein [Dysgonamonadaceae bacterium]
LHSLTLGRHDGVSCWSLGNSSALAASSPTRCCSLPHFLWSHRPVDPRSVATAWRHLYYFHAFALISRKFEYYNSKIFCTFAKYYINMVDAVS